MNDIKFTPLLDTLRLEKIDDATYFSSKYSNYISNSRLGLINPDQGGSPESFFSGFKPIYSSSLDIGSAVHGLVLQPEAFNIVTTVDKPTGKMGVMCEELFTLCEDKAPTEEQIISVATKVDYYKGIVTPNRMVEIKSKFASYQHAKISYLWTRTNDGRVDLYLDPKSRETALSCIKSLQDNIYVQDILKPKGVLEEPEYACEQAILLDIRVDIPNNGGSFILKLKSKLDHYVIDKEFGVIQVNDVKTLGRILSDFPLNVQKFHYSRELAMYAYLLTLVAKKYYGLENPTVRGHYLVVSTIPQFYSKVVQVTKKEFQEGFLEFKRLLKMVAMEVATNHKEFAEWI